jgi:YidC/Oxa1 family membrane protein insertase
MDKNTLLAIVLSVVVISVGFLIQGVLFPPDPTATIPQTEQTAPAADGSVGDAGQPATETTATDTAPAPTGAAQTPTVGSNVLEAVPLETALEQRSLTIETDIFTVTLSNEGGTIESLLLNEHLDGDEYVDIINNGTTGMNAFNVSFGEANTQPISVLFQQSQPNANSVEYFRDFIDLNGNQITMTKRY